MTIAELQKEFLTAGRKRIAPEDFFILLAHTLKKDRVFLFAHPEYTISAASEVRARNFFSRRAHHEPVAIILGYKEFYGRDFFVTKDTLIPRPETEVLIDLALEEITKYKTNGVKKIALVDVGTGSGNIIITLVKEIKKVRQSPDIRYYATDISAPALAIAKKNARQHRVSNIIKFHKGDLLDPYLPYTKVKTSTIIAANLPYISHAIYRNITKDVRDFEPARALVSKQSGLAHYYSLLKIVKNTSQLRPITLFLEISPEQSFSLQKYVIKLFPNAFIAIKKDLAGKKRVLTIRVGLT